MKHFLLFISVALASVAHGGAFFGGPTDLDDVDLTEKYPVSSVTMGENGMPNYSASCANIPADVKRAYAEAKAFSVACPTAKLAPGKKIAINDYSAGGEARMYIFNQSGGCLGSVSISWGGGAGGRKEACSTNNSKMTPPGFHITAPHNGSRYNESNSIGLAGLSGQDSLGDRGILIHPVGYTTNRGNTWGCTGVPDSDFADLKRSLGYGSLVYNYFGSSGSSSCGDRAGFAPQSCKPESKAVAIFNKIFGGYSYSNSAGGSTIRRSGASGGSTGTGSSGATTRGGTR